MYKVGLTGGIATGKSHTLDLLRSFGCHIIDADEIARLVVQPGQPAYQDLLAHFGPRILSADGTIDRKRLGAIVFGQEGERRKLNKTVHPRIAEEIGARLEALERMDPDGLVVVDGALIFESGVQSVFDAVIVVYCDEQEQLTRLMNRDGLSRQEALQRIRAQMSSSEKRRHADFEIDTSGTFEQTRQQVEAIYRALCSRARSSNQSACA